MSDLISKSKLIEFLESRTGEFADDTGKGWNSGIETAIRVVKKFPSIEQKSEWISVKDRLPEKDGRYLVVTECFKTHPQYVVIRYFYKENSKKFECSSENFTHWMPLPEPPKGDTE